MQVLSPTRYHAATQANPTALSLFEEKVADIKPRLKKLGFTVTSVVNEGVGFASFEVGPGLCVVMGRQDRAPKVQLETDAGFFISPPVDTDRAMSNLLHIGLHHEKQQAELARFFAQKIFIGESVRLLSPLP